LGALVPADRAARRRREAPNTWFLEAIVVRADFPWLPVAVLIIAISLGVMGQILLKLGLNRLGEKPPPVLVLKSVFTPLIFGGFACYGLSSLVYLQALSRLPLRYAYPMIALSYVGVALISWRWMHEQLNPLRFAGLAVIILGVVLLALSYGPSPAAASPKAP